MDHRLSPSDRVTSFRAYRPVPRIVFVDLLHGMGYHVFGVCPAAGEGHRVSEQFPALLDAELIRTQVQVGIRLPSTCSRLIIGLHAAPGPTFRISAGEPADGPISKEVA